MNFNSKELEKIGLMLDDIVSKSKYTFELIDYDLQQICDILSKYHDIEIISFRKEASNYSSQWFNSKNNILYVGSMLSNKIINYCKNSVENEKQIAHEINEVSKNLNDIDFN